MKTPKGEEGRERIGNGGVRRINSNQLPLNIMTFDKPPFGRKLFSPKKEIAGEKVSENPIVDENMLTGEFKLDEGSSLNINCNMVSVLPHEYNQEIEVEEPEEVDEVKMRKHKPVCYYMLNNGAVKELNAFFEIQD